MERSITFDDLPPEVVAHLFHYVCRLPKVSTRWILSLRLVSRQFSETIMYSYFKNPTTLNSEQTSKFVARELCHHLRALVLNLNSGINTFDPDAQILLNKATNLKYLDLGRVYLRPYRQLSLPRHLFDTLTELNITVIIPYTSRQEYSRIGFHDISQFRNLKHLTFVHEGDVSLESTRLLSSLVSLQFNAIVSKTDKFEPSLCDFFSKSFQTIRQLSINLIPENLQDWFNLLNMCSESLEHLSTAWKLSGHHVLPCLSNLKSLILDGHEKTFTETYIDLPGFPNLCYLELRHFDLSHIASAPNCQNKLTVEHLEIFYGSCHQFPRKFIEMLRGDSLKRMNIGHLGGLSTVVGETLATLILEHSSSLRQIFINTAPIEILGPIEQCKQLYALAFENFDFLLIAKNPEKLFKSSVRYIRYFGGRNASYIFCQLYICKQSECLPNLRGIVVNDRETVDQIHKGIDSPRIVNLFQVKARFSKEVTGWFQEISRIAGSPPLRPQRDYETSRSYGWKW